MFSTHSLLTKFCPVFWFRSRVLVPDFILESHLLRNCIKMSARMESPAKTFVLLVCALLSIRSAQTLKNDKFSEELYINSMNNGHVLSHFQFTTLWNASIADQNTCTEFRGRLKTICMIFFFSVSCVGIGAL